MSATEQPAPETFWDHLTELRRCVVRILAAALLCAAVAFVCKERLFAVVLAPGRGDFVTYRLLDAMASWTSGGGAAGDFSVELINTGLAEQFLIHVRTAFYAGLLCVSPYALYLLFGFVSPALYERERRYAIRVAGGGYVMFLAGAALSYFLIFPLTFRFLGTYQVSPEVTNMITLQSYVDTLMLLSLWLGVIFEIPIVCWLLGRFGMLSAPFMRRYRRHAVLAILIAAAVITPTSDVFTLMLVSLPMWLLYEAGILIVSRTGRSRGSVGEPRL